MESGAAHLGCSRADLKHRRYHLLHLPPASAQHIHKLPRQVARDTAVAVVRRCGGIIVGNRWCRISPWAASQVLILAASSGDTYMQLDDPH